MIDYVKAEVLLPTEQGFEKYSPKLGENVLQISLLNFNMSLQLAGNLSNYRDQEVIRIASDIADNDIGSIVTELDELTTLGRQSILPLKFVYDRCMHGAWFNVYDTMDSRPFDDSGLLKKISQETDLDLAKLILKSSDDRSGSKIGERTLCGATRMALLIYTTANRIASP
jgi:hypothetical protein